ncbi:MAG: glycosyltransferase family 87 protein [Bacteroidota bacterium]
MHWADVREGLREGLREVAVRPHLAVPAAMMGAWLLAMPVYLSAVFYDYALDEPDLFLVDYSFFHYAALRFVENPLALYVDPEYLYPPPAVLVFLPATWASGPVGYITLGPLIFGALAVAYAWALRIWEREAADLQPSLPRHGGRERQSGSGLRVPSTPVRLALLLVALGSGPTFQNLKYAQVNVLVLLSALAFLHLAQRGKPGWGALALSGGFWLKLLPMALLPLALWKRWPRLAMGTLAGLVAVPVLLLPLIPLELYREYVFERLPAFSGATDLGSMSNSIQASITRLGYPIQVVVRGGMLPASGLASAVAVTIGVGVLGAATIAAWMGRLGRVRAGFVILAILPAVVPLGWEHTFVLAVPLLLVVLAEAERQPVWIRVLVALAALAFFAQRLPPPQMAFLVDLLPRPVIDLYMARLWLATLGLIGLGLAPALRVSQRETEPLGASASVLPRSDRGGAG